MIWNVLPYGMVDQLNGTLFVQQLLEFSTAATNMDKVNMFERRSTLGMKMFR